MWNRISKSQWQLHAQKRTTDYQHEAPCVLWRAFSAPQGIEADTIMYGDLSSGTYHIKHVLSNEEHKLENTMRTKWSGIGCTVVWGMTDNWKVPRTSAYRAVIWQAIALRCKTLCDSVRVLPSESDSDLLLSLWYCIKDDRVELP